MACFDTGNEKRLTAARGYLAQGDSAAAVIEAKNYLSTYPDSAAGRLLLGRALMAAGDLDGAATELQRAEGLGHDPVELAPALAALWLAQQQPRQVVTRFDGTVLAQPLAAAELMTLVAQAQRELGQAQKAKESVDAALRQSPGFQPAVVLGARLAAERGDIAAAQRVAESLVGLQDADAEAWLLQGDMLELRGQSEASVHAYRKALEANPRHAQAHIALIAALMRLQDAQAVRAQVSAMRNHVPNLPMVDYLDGLAAWQRGDLDRAKEMMDQLARRAVPDARTLLLSGLVQSRLGNTVQAESMLSRAVDAAPQWLDARREYAGMLLKLAQPERALAVLRPALTADAPDAALWGIAGQAYSRLGDFRQADTAFSRAEALRPGDAALQAAEARSQIARGKVDLGLQTLRDAARTDTDRIDHDLALVAALMMRGQRNAALQALDVAGRKQPASPLPPYLRGRALETAADRNGARAAYELALAKNPRHRQSIEALAAMDLADRKPEAARNRYESLIQLDPKAAPWARLALADLALRTGRPVTEVRAGIDRAVLGATPDAALWLAAIDLQRRLGDPAATLARAQAANAALPDEATLLLEFANAQFAAGDQRQAIASLRRAIVVRPQWAEAHLRLAAAHGATGDTAAAREPLNRALALAPDSPAVLRASVALALSDRQPEKARALAMDVQKLRPQHALGWELQAEIEAALGNTQAAAAAWRAALERGVSPERAVKLHRALLVSNATEALQFRQRWLREHPEDAFFVVHLADTAQAAGQAAEAEARYRQALRLQPDNALVMNNLAEVLLARDGSEALALAQRATRLLPQVPAILDTLASAHARSEQHDQAVAAQRRAVELLPGNPTLRLNLARHLAARGDWQEAKEQLQRAMKSGLPTPQLEEAQQLRQRLGA